MLKQPLNDNWTVRAASNLHQIPAHIRDATIPARVPGCIHTDLLRAALIDDPYFGQNEPKLRWIGETDWRYTTSFDVDSRLFDHERRDLVCDGLDTVAEIELNGSHIASTQNMHRGYRFDVRPHLKKRRNELTITFTSPVSYVQMMYEKLGHLPAVTFGGRFNFIRKMACNFGWDWGPNVATSGIWRGVRLEGWSRSRIENVRTRVDSVSANETILSVAVDIERTGTSACDIALELFRPEGRGEVMFARGDGLLRFTVPHATLWWPRQHGSQYLYELNVISVEEGQSDQVEKKIGLRTVELDTSPDDIGRKFVLKVNGKPIFCKGYNWIPDDCFLDRVTPERYRRRIQQARDANCNMLRVWGGGIYESAEFYDICDELGMLVWQDFLFACAAYPEEEPFRSEVEAEARENVARLSHHPSLVLWNGCNENLWGYHSWGGDDGTGQHRMWKDQLVGKTWGAGYYMDLLPRIVKELDGSRPYWAASPWSGDADIDNGLHPNLSTHGNKHIWEVWHGPGDYNNYRWFVPRFCSEFGYQGPANYSTMAHWFEPAELHRGSATMQMHQKSREGNERNDRLAAKDFDLPENFDDWHYLLQLNQSRALSTGCEWFRARQPVCMGTLIWQLNDCYPATSWAAIDGDGRPKPLLFATRRFYAPRLLTIQPEADAHVLYANNDTDEPWRGEAAVRRIDFAGNELAKIALAVDVPPRGNQRVAVLPISIVQPRDRSREMVVASLEPGRALWYFTSDRELAYPPPAPTAKLDREGDAWRLTLSTATLLRDIVINIDRVDPEAIIDDNVVTLLPGESHVFSIRSAKEMRLEALTNPPVFQCANRFGRR